MTTYKLVAGGSEAHKVNPHMFGGNIIGEVNESSGTPNNQFQEVINELGNTRLRYPAGKAEPENITELDHTKSGTGKLRSDLVEYLDWVKETGTETTLVIPALEERASNADIREWAELVMEHMGGDADLIVAYEIGNEYWGTDDEIEYGGSARDIIRSLQESMDNDGIGHEPGIWIQTANPVGSSSSYNGGNSGSISDDDAVSALSTWNIEDRPSNWELGQSANQYFNSLSAFEKVVIRANLELLEQLDSDRDISNGFQASSEGLSVDGIVAHFFYNKSDGEFGGDEDAWKSNYLNHRFDVWEAMLPQDVSIQVTEWNVRAHNSYETGLKGAGVLQEQFQSMVEMGVDGADFWALRHNTPNSIAGDYRDQSPVSLSPSGLMYKYMSENLGGTGRKAMSTLDVSGYDHSRVEVNVYESDYKTVIYVTSRSDTFGQEVSLDISSITSGARHWTGRHVGIDPASSDGLSENWGYDEDGQKIMGTRLARRSITEEERDALRELLGKDLADPHIRIADDGEYITYLPNVEGIIPKVGNPQTLDDFYFATETDVLGQETGLSKADLGTSADNLTVELDPYEFVEITVHTTQRIGGNSSSEKLAGAWGRDLIFGNGGTDKVFGKLGVDRLYGGNGSDIMHGGFGNDTVKGGNGNDSIRGGRGKDLMIGDAGDDVFVFRQGDLLEFNPSKRHRLDKIKDFTIGEDKILLDLDDVDDLGDLRMWRDFANDQFVIAVQGTDERFVLEGDYLWTEMYSASNFDFV